MRQGSHSRYNLPELSGGTPQLTARDALRTVPHSKKGGTFRRLRPPPVIQKDFPKHPMGAGPAW